jgi:hypothetical protein
MGGIGFNIEILGSNDTDNIGSRLVKAALTIRRISTAWTIPFEAVGAVQNFNARERMKGEILRRYSSDVFSLLRDRPGHGVLIKAQVLGNDLDNVRMVGAGTDPETVALSDWCSCVTTTSDMYFWVTTYEF